MERAQFERKAIPDRGTSRREGPILFNGRVRTWYKIVTTRLKHKIRVSNIGLPRGTNLIALRDAGASIRGFTVN